MGCRTQGLHNVERSLKGVASEADLRHNLGGSTYGDDLDARPTAPPQPLPRRAANLRGIGLFSGFGSAFLSGSSTSGNCGIRHSYPPPRHDAQRRPPENHGDSAEQLHREKGARPHCRLAHPRRHPCLHRQLDQPGPPIHCRARHQHPRRRRAVRRGAPRPLHCPRRQCLQRRSGRRGARCLHRLDKGQGRRDRHHKTRLNAGASKRRAHAPARAPILQPPSWASPSAAQFGFRKEGQLLAKQEDY